MISSLQFASTA